MENETNASTNYNRCLIKSTISYGINGPVYTIYRTEEQFKLSFFLNKTLVCFPGMTGHGRMRPRRCRASRRQAERNGRCTRGGTVRHVHVVHTETGHDLAMVALPARHQLGRDRLVQQVICEVPHVVDAAETVLFCERLPCQQEKCCNENRK